MSCDVTQCQPDLRRCKWQRPPTNFVAVNCDGSFRPRNRSVGYGIIIRDQHGKFIKAKANHGKIIGTEKLHGPIVLMQEMMAILDGLELAMKMKFSSVDVQSDSKNAVEIINNSKARCPKECRGILEKIRGDTRSFDEDNLHFKFDEDNLHFKFVYREKNRAADFLSKVLKSDGERYYDYGGWLPDNLEKIVEEDANGHEIERIRKI